MAKLRAELGWTQAQLAARIGMSRVALSHVEANLSLPSQRTVTLLAGVFRLEPHELVEGTDYPAAKAERLPVVAARYTEVEHQLAVFAAVLDVLDRLASPDRARLARHLREQWHPRLFDLLASAVDPEERRSVRSAIRGLSAY